MRERRPDGGFARLVPELDVRDLAVSLEFWCDALGFTVAYARPEAAFAYLERAGAQVMLNTANENWSTGPLAPPFGRGINLQIQVVSAEPILQRLDALGWPLFRPLHEAWYRIGRDETGCRQFLVQDPDGYLLRFSADLGTRPLGPDVQINPGVQGS
jgi:catechol 2,3-dioxygenase-like lactoylglutathione lyase family enzyme